jgi:hypothetical protein
VPLSIARRDQAGQQHVRAFWNPIRLTRPQPELAYEPGDQPTLHGRLPG